MDDGWQLRDDRSSRRTDGGIRSLFGQAMLLLLRLNDNSVSTRTASALPTRGRPHHTCHLPWPTTAAVSPALVSTFPLKVRSKQAHHCMPQLDPKHHVILPRGHRRRHPSKPALACHKRRGVRLRRTEKQHAAARQTFLQNATSREVLLNSTF